MALNRFFTKLKTQDRDSKENFLALEITQDTVKSAIWIVEDKETQVLKVGTIEEWQEENQESFLKAADASISSVLEGVTPEPKGILFGLPEDWVEKEVILTKRKQLLRQVCQKLDLKPLGFVVTLEALVQHFKLKQGTPLNAILIRISDTELIISLVRMGKVMGSEIVGRTDDLAADVKEGIARFNVDDFPPRMILYNGITDFEEAKQQLLSFDWQKELSFLHFPKIESLTSDISIRAIAIAGGSEVARSLGFEITETSSEDAEEKEAGTQSITKSDLPEPETPPKTPVLETETKPEADIPKEEEPAPLTGNINALGFVKNKDILSDGLKKTTPEEPKALEATESEKMTESKESLLPSHKTLDFDQKREDRLKKTEKSAASTGKPFKLLPRIKGKIHNFKAWFKSLLVGLRFRVPVPRLAGLIGLIIGVFVVLIGGGLAFYWYAPRAEVVIFVAPKVLEKDLSLQVSTDTKTIDIEKGVIPGKIRETDIEGDLSAETTGKKLVGEKASGTAEILNKTDSAKAFKAGAVLVGPDSLRFELADEVTVASKSSELTDDGEKVTYGKAQVKVVAADIGPEYNLGSDTELSFKDYSEGKFTIKAKEGFSGGTSREIRAVSEEDQENLLKKLTDKLKEEAKDKLLAEADDQELFKEGIQAKTVKASFDKEVDEESEAINLHLKVKLSALSFSQADFNTLLLHSLSASLPDEFQIKTEDIETEVQEVTGDDIDSASIRLVAKAKLLPEYDLEVLGENLVGKYPQLVQGYLSTLPNFVKADVSISPKLPGKLGTLPRVKDRIKITVEALE